MGGLSGPNANSVNIQEVKEKEEKLKKCVVHFRPKDGWRGGYGFDWIRLPNDPYRESKDNEGHVASDSSFTYGKYACPAKRVLIKANKNQGNYFIATQECTAFDDGNFNADLEGDPVYFCRSYIIYHGLKLPVNNNGKVVMFDMNSGKKVVTFTRAYVEEDTEEKEEKKKEKKKENKKDEKKEKKDNKSGPRLKLFNIEDPRGDEPDAAFSSDEPKEQLQLLDLDTIPQPPKFKPYTWLTYRFTFEKGEFKELHVSELNSKRKITLTSKSQLKKVSKKDKEFFRLNGDIVDSCWKNVNMDESSLRSNLRNLGVTVDNNGAKTVVLNNGQESITLNYEDGAIISALYSGKNGKVRMKNKEEIKKNGSRFGITEDMINDKGMDFMSLVKVINYDSFSISMENANKLVELPLQVHADVKNGKTDYVVDSFNGNDNADDRLMHEYWRDYAGTPIFIRNPYGKFNEDSVHGIYWDVMEYYKSVLAIPFSNNTEFKEIKREAEIQLFIRGEYDKIELVLNKKDEDKIKLSKDTIKSGSTVNLTVKIKEFFNEEATITALSEGMIVGELKVIVQPIFSCSVCFINVNLIDGMDKYSVPEDGWNPKVEDTREVFLQAGIYLDRLKGGIDINYSDLEAFYDPSYPKAVIFRDTAQLQPFAPDTSIIDVIERELFAHPEKYETAFDAIRVYIFNAARVNDGDFFIYGYRMPNIRDVALIFKKSIEIMGMEKSNVIAHELGHLLGLEHPYHSYKTMHTMQNGCTSNVMDISEVKYSWTQSQWKTLRYNCLKHYS